ncbi:unnamed protein product [Candida verbasci]|uniref:DUF962-domain-containing protein n=1 Tax=Candida verbasci TaxID=1227364 RepID=A0A9W4XC11_9ASCO|nr:unnamed protein product [Candida verbasci]
MTSSYLEDQLVFYRSYHSNATNVAIHVVCIPIILLSTITFFSPIQVFSPTINLGTLLAWGYGLYYILLDWQVGVPSFAILVTYSSYITQFYLTLNLLTTPTSKQFINYAIFAHVVAWLAQFVGHSDLFEGRKPALLNSTLSALTTAPLFSAFEVCWFLGFKKDLKKTMDNRAGKNIRDFRQKQMKTA